MGRVRGTKRVASGPPCAGRAAQAVARSRVRESASRRATHKFNDNFRNLSGEESDIIVDPVSKLTLRETLVKAIEAKDEGALGEMLTENM